MRNHIANKGNFIKYGQKISPTAVRDIKTVKADRLNLLLLYLFRNVFHN